MSHGLTSSLNEKLVAILIEFRRGEHGNPISHRTRPVQSREGIPRLKSRKLPPDHLGTDTFVVKLLEVLLREHQKMGESVVGI